MPSDLVGKTVSPFLKEHIPGLYAPFGKASMPLSPPPTNDTTVVRKKDPNSKFCYRHRPDSKCRRAADESKMGFIQSELNSLSSADQEAITHVWSLFSAAPAKHRDLMLQGIITQCCFPQLSTVSREVQEQLKIDFLAALPTELSYKILSYLDTVSLCKAAQVSRRWRSLADDDVVWHRMCEQHIDRKCTKCGWGLPLLEKKKLQAWSRHQQNHRQPNAADVVEIDDEAETQVGESRKRQATDDEHEDCDRSFKRSRANPGSNGSFDKTIKVWNWQTGECLNTLQCHNEGVLSIHYDGCTVASGSIDKTIKVSSFKTKETFCLRGHTDWVNHVRMDSPSRVVFSASDDLSVKLWDIETRQCIKTFLGHVGQVQQVLLMPADFEPDEVPSLDNTDTVSVSSGRSNTPPAEPSEQTVDARASYGSGFTSDPDRPLPPRYMLTGGLDNTVRLWDTVNGKCIRSMFGHVEGIWGLVGDTLRVVTGANDSMTKIWEPRSGKCERSFTGHAGPVTCVGLSDSRMASGSEDGEVRIYSFEGERVEERGTPS
ncbi:sulfur controller 2 [Fusarium graminearum PH-1]|uniref:sulfur controller 2 n=1 Tax=Gibberella zeae (strain ATCC MYA-4620 / CBS 123657 / FGSC 9075 / NRRL 31084 / PH-1) TaxID=229533 RepID=UPI00021F22CA|nr:sulfur controller 2 [Fusarium graminearum PH-1]ESU12694.1 sulfur controller 2 [Fusarium graminearum PH-1]|eukprot:XP_011326201.1 sulfur controller 2 [Fusarium graminearum PH-1]